MICKKEKECEDLLAELATKSEENSALTNQVEELMDSEKKQSKTILQLQDLASVQKNHLVSVEESSRVEKEKLQDKLEKIKSEANLLQMYLLIIYVWSLSVCRSIQ